MSQVLSFPLQPDTAAGFRFGRVELQLAAARVLIAGREVALAPTGHALLLALCRAQGGLLTRDRAFELLWPNGGVGSDEALAQIVFKLRQALGPDGRCITTVRGRGYRLDASVVALAQRALSDPPATASADVAADEHTAAEAAPLAAPPRVTRSATADAALARRRFAFALAAIAVLAPLALVLAWHMLGREPERIDAFAMYDLRDGELGPMSAQGEAMWRRALQLDAGGHRREAMRMLEALHASETGSAAPALLLSVYHDGVEQFDAARQWLAQFESRRPHPGSPYAELLARWLQKEGDGDELALLDALLAARSGADGLRLRRAHMMLSLGRMAEFERDMRVLRPERLPLRSAIVALADLASLGLLADDDARVRALERSHPAQFHYLRGRIALGERRWADAEREFVAAIEVITRERLSGALQRVPLYAAAAAGELGAWDRVEAHLQLAARLWPEAEFAALHADADVMLAFALRRLQRAQEARAVDARALAVLQRNAWPRTRFWLQQARHDPASADALADLERLGEREPLAGTGDLVAARAAWLRCDAPAALQALQRARAAGIDAGYLADEAALLARDLGETAPAPGAPRIPYPYLGRWVTRWAGTLAPAPRPCEAPAPH
jgi:DNA-binding winged helix-turn-helix (wHTH) protein